MEKNELIKNKISALLKKKEPVYVDEKERAKLLIDDLFREKAAQQRGLLLSIAEQKIQSLGKISSVTQRIMDSIEVDLDELQYYSIDEKIKLLSDIVRAGAVLSASTELIKNLLDSLNDFKNTIERRGEISEESKAKIELLIARITAESR